MTNIITYEQLDQSPYDNFKITGTDIRRFEKVSIILSKFDLLYRLISTRNYIIGNIWGITSEGKSKRVGKIGIACGICSNHMISDINEGHRIKNKLICSTCYDSLNICSCCSKPYIGEGILASTGRICMRCFETKFTICNSCGDIYPNIDIYSVDRNMYCKACKDLYSVNCYICNNPVHKNKCEYDLDRPICSECSYRNNPIDKYNHVPTYVPYGDKHDTLLGLELEMECTGYGIKGKHNIASKMVNIHPSLFCKHDGSLENGFEVVTHPITYKYLLDTNIIEDISKIARTHGCKAHYTTTCGIHIHVSRDSITTLQLFRVMAFFRKYINNILSISQRGRDKLDRWSRIDTEMKSLYYKCKEKYYTEKYYAINFNKPYSYEFRIFRGNLRPERIKKNIEFVLSLLEFCRDISINENTWDNYCKFLNLHAKQYRHILDYINNDMAKPHENND